MYLLYLITALGLNPFFSLHRRGVFIALTRDSLHEDYPIVAYIDFFDFWISQHRRTRLNTIFIDLA